MDNQCAFLKINLWLTGILLKAVPCVLLLIFTFCLLTKIKENSKKRSALLHTDDKRSDRITYVLLLMVAVFLSTELPQGVFAIFNAIFTYQFHGFIYMSIADILDLLSLINCYVGFLVYVITSSKYRETLWTLIPFLKNGYVKTQSHASNHKGMGRKQKAGDTISIDVRKDDHV
ncbi:hypothetical protein L596_001779 [Steinernema carpocapsae]|nr:hypothetical protein L596_001779 [Steinernema carpocapsae]